MVSASRAVFLLLFVACCALLAVGCVGTPGALPTIAAAGRDRGFPTQGTQPTALAEAVIRDDLAEVESLLAAGADPNVRWGRQGDRFPLQEAIQAIRFPRRDSPPPNRDAIIRALLSHGADPNARFCFYESRGSVLDILDGVNPSSPPLRCYSRLATTVLMAAVVHGQPATVYRLLDAGADPHAVDWNYNTALDLAPTDLIHQLLLAAAYPGPDGERQAAATLRERLGPSLGWIADSQYRLFWPDGLPPARQLRLLFISMGTGKPATDSDRRALGWMVRHADWPLLQFMVERGVNLNQARWCQSFEPPPRAGVEGPIEPGCVPEKGITRLMRAAYYGAVDDEEWQIAHGADPSITDWAGRTADDYRRMGEAARASEARRR